MRQLLFIATLIFTASNLYGQETTTLYVNTDSIDFFYTKEEITRRTFKRLKLDYDYFVNPGKEFNTTDMYHPRAPGCRLTVCMKYKTTIIILYECGGYGGPMTLCLVANEIKRGYETFRLKDDIRDLDELWTLMNTGQLTLVKRTI